MMQAQFRPFAAAILLGGLACSLSAQPPAKPDPAVKESLKKYRSLITDRKGAKDPAAIEIIDELLKKYEAMHPKDQEAMAKGIAESLLSTRVKREPTEDSLYRATIKALSLTGKNGSKYLAQAYDKKAKYKDKEWYSLRGDMLEHLGRCKDPKYIDFLLDEALKSPRDPLMAKAGGALRHYAEEKLTVRKMIAEKLIKKFATIYTSANQNLDPGDLTRKTWEDRLAAVSDPWNTTLQALTKQHFRSSNDWTRFWNKEKGSDWDKPATTKRGG